MNTSPAESLFIQGLKSMSKGRHEEAATQFKEAMELEKGRGAPRRQMRYLSYYGLSLARAHKPTREAIDACRIAAKRDPWDPDLQLNLGRVLALAGQTTRALATLERGLRLAPRHKALRAELRRHDRRSRPPVPFFTRDHPLNRTIGKLRAAILRRRAEKAEAEALHELSDAI